MNKFPLVVMGILAILIISGCTSGGTGQITSKDTGDQQTPVPAQTYSIPDPENIEYFGGVKEGDMIRFYFAFDDTIGHSGRVDFVIKDSLNKTVYESQFDVNKNQFVDYEYRLTSIGIGKAFEIKISFNDIEKGMSDYGNAFLTFTTINGKTMTSETFLFEIPSYTSEEIEEIYETRYIESAKTSGDNVKKGNFDVTLVRYGYYTHTEWDEEVTDFRADIEVENIGNDENIFSIYSGALIVENKQYDVGFESTFEGYNIYPGVVKEGYLIFDDVPEDLSGEANLIVGSSWSGFSTPDYAFIIQL